MGPVIPLGVREGLCGIMFTWCGAITISCLLRCICINRISNLRTSTTNIHENRRIYIHAYSLSLQCMTCSYNYTKCIFGSTHIIPWSWSTCSYRPKYVILFNPSTSPSMMHLSQSIFLQAHSFFYIWSMLEIPLAILYASRGGRNSSTVVEDS